MRFPRVDGYQQAIRNRVTVDWDEIASVRVDSVKIPDEARLKPTLLNKGRSSFSEPGGSTMLNLDVWRKSTRLQQQEFEMAASLTRLGRRRLGAPARLTFATERHRGRSRSMENYSAFRMLR